MVVVMMVFKMLVVLVVTLMVVERTVVVLLEMVVVEPGIVITHPLSRGLPRCCAARRVSFLGCEDKAGQSRVHRKALDGACIG